MPDRHTASDLYPILLEIKSEIGKINGTLGGMAGELARVSTRVEQVDRDALERHSDLGRRVAILEKDKAEKKGRTAILYGLWGVVVIAFAQILSWVLK